MIRIQALDLNNIGFFKRVFFCFGIWAALCAALIRNIQGIVAFLILSTVFFVNFFFIYMVSRSIINAARGCTEHTKIIFWFFMKFSMLLLALTLFYAFRFSPDIVIVLGLLTWVVVPLAVGVFIAQRGA